MDLDFVGLGFMFGGFGFRVHGHSGFGFKFYRLFGFGFRIHGLRICWFRVYELTFKIISEYLHVILRNMSSISSLLSTIFYFIPLDSIIHVTEN